MDEDSEQLGIIRPNIEPRATLHIDGMIAMISKLIQKGHAYQAANGDVFYKIRSFSDYGKLSGKSLDDLRAGERVEIDSFKQDPMDFVLWKSVKPNEPNWDSPWGKGRPGWHIECSVMSAHHLGHHFDIHGGGQDLQFPHHENEIAQSEAVHSCTMANYWMHNGFVRVDDEKMSKSLGNFFTIREVLKKYNAEVLRFFIIRAQYRSPLNYSDKHLDDAKASLTRLYTSLRGLEVVDQEIDWNLPQAARFKEAMDDDFNTPEALAVLFDLANEVNKNKSLEAANLLKSLGNLIGLLQSNAEEFLQGKKRTSILASQYDDIAISSTVGFSDVEINAFILSRLEAKKTKNFGEADRIRKELADAGVVLEDTPQGTTWRRA
jgi:cysteinyl-tRNA synthetase